MPLISVIIPNYNHAAFLKERIDSVLNQTYTDFELIILDDRSTDNSREIIEQYRDHPKLSHILYNNTNSGYPSRQWQKGVQQAKGEWIWIAESDDHASPLFLETLIRCMQTYPSAGLVYSNSYKENADTAARFKTTGEETNLDFSTNNWNDTHLINGEIAINNYLSKKNIILNISSALIKKKWLDKLLADASKLKYFGDWYIYIRMAIMADIAYCHPLLNTFRRHPGSLILNSTIKGIKTDYFRILNLLVKQPAITDKSEVINYFTDHYLKPGLKAEGRIFFLRLITRWLLIDPRLAIMVTQKIIRAKLKHG